MCSDSNTLSRLQQASCYSDLACIFCTCVNQTFNAQPYICCTWKVLYSESYLLDPLLICAHFSSKFFSFWLFTFRFLEYMYTCIYTCRRRTAFQFLSSSFTPIHVFLFIFINWKFYRYDITFIALSYFLLHFYSKFNGCNLIMELVMHENLYFAYLH